MSPLTARYRAPRSLRRLLPLALAGAGIGCAQQGPLLSQRTTVGSLKASVSRLEYENQQMRSQIKGLQAENRRLEDRLVREESLNGELSARLDDARDVLSRRGGLTDRDEAFDPATLEPRQPPARTLPAGNTNRATRKPPFAQIPGRIDDARLAPPTRGRPDDDEAARGSAGGTWRGDEGTRKSPGDVRLWLPIAVGTTDPSTTRR